jgi:hypothetical protein
MKTYANGSYFGTKMHEKLGLQYEWKLETFESQFPTDLPPAPALKPLSYHDFVRGLLPPNPAIIRALYSSGYYLPLVPCGYSQFDQNVHEIQNVKIGPDDTFAL